MNKVVALVVLLFAALTIFDLVQKVEGRRREDESEITTKIEAAYERGYADGYEEGERVTENKYPSASEREREREESNKFYWEDGYSCGHFDGYRECYDDYRNGTLDRDIIK